MTPDLTIHALGTQVRAAGAGAFAALREVSRLENLLTRFSPSPLTRLNDAGKLDQPPAELQSALEHALQVAGQTQDWITPTVLSALEAAGYTHAPGAGTPSGPVPVPSVAGIRVTSGQISLPPGVRLDLGGTAKSWIVREAARQFTGNSLLDAGGDLQLTSDQPVTIGIEPPGQGPASPPVFLNLPAGTHGVATSSILKRAWPGGHHLIDPRTGTSARTPFVQVTALTTDVTVAEVLTKLALLNARDVLQEWLARSPAQLLAFDAAGQRFLLHGLAWERWAA